VHKRIQEIQFGADPAGEFGRGEELGIALRSAM
jgi:hypothetical protein